MMTRPILCTLISVCLHVGAVYFAGVLPVRYSRHTRLDKGIMAASLYIKPVPESKIGGDQKTISRTRPRNHMKINHNKEKEIAATGSEGFSPSSTHSDRTDGDTRSARRDRPVLISGQTIKMPYPKKAKLMQIEGTVRLRLTVSDKGEVTDALVLTGPAFGLHDTALALVRKLAFLPATDEEGRPKVAHIEHEVVFKLNQDADPIAL